MTKSAPIYARLARAWHGEEKLWVAFWLYFFTATNVLWVVEGLIGPRMVDLLFMPLTISKIIAIALMNMVFDVSVRIFQIIIVWRSAKNTKYHTAEFFAKGIIIWFALATIYGVYKLVLYIVVEGYLQ